MRLADLMAGQIDVVKGLKELREKQMLQIERETAKTWGGRAAASFQLAIEAAKLGERVRHLYEGENYRQEALEHAAMTEDLEFLQDVAEEIEDYRKEALENIQELLTKTDEDLGVPADVEGQPNSRRTQRAGGKHRTPGVTRGARGGPAAIRGERTVPRRR